MIDICSLCKRPIDEKSDGSKHHLIPKCKKGRNTPTVLLHKICHNKIHSLFSPNDLKTQYNNIDELLKHDDIQTFVNWVKKKPNNFYQTTKLKK